MNSLFFIALVLLVLSMIPTNNIQNEVIHFILYILKAGLAGWIVGGLYYFISHL